MAYGVVDLPPLYVDDDGAGNKVPTTKIIDGSTGGLTPLAFVDSDGVATIPVSIFDDAGNQINSFAGPTEYDEGDTDASITGSAILWEDTSDTLRAVSASKPLPVDIKAQAAVATGGYSKVSYLAQTTTLRAVKGSAGKLAGWYLYNPNASAVYVQIFDLASGSVTLGTTTPTMVLAIPAGSAANVNLGSEGIDFATAITIAVTTTESGSSAPGSGCTLNFWYK